MTKIVINTQYGGFRLSAAAVKHYAKIKGIALVSAPESFNVHGIARDDPALVQVVEEMGMDANVSFSSSLKVVEIPDDVGSNWHIENYNGKEHVAENHWTWS